MPVLSCRIICTGHSLGGALATLAAVWARVALVKHIPVGLQASAPTTRKNTKGH